MQCSHKSFFPRSCSSSTLYWPLPDQLPSPRQQPRHPMQKSRSLPSFWCFLSARPSATSPVHPAWVLTCPPLASSFAWARAIALHWPPTLTSLLFPLAGMEAFPVCSPPQGIPMAPTPCASGPCPPHQVHCLLLHHCCSPAPLVFLPQGLCTCCSLSPPPIPSTVSSVLFKFLRRSFLIALV